MPKTLSLLILAAGISYGGTLDYSLRWYEYGTPTPTDCNPTYGDLSLTVKCAGMPAATAQIRNSPFLLGIMNSYAPYGIGIDAYARYSGSFIVEGGSGAGFLDLTFSGGGSNHFSGSVEIENITRFVSGVSVYSPFQIPITFGVPVPYVLEVRASAAYSEPIIDGSEHISGFVVRDAAGAIITDGTVTETPEPSTAAMLAIASLLVVGYFEIHKFVGILPRRSTKDFNSFHHADCHVPDGSPTIPCGSIRGRMRGSPLRSALIEKCR